MKSTSICIFILFLYSCKHTPLLVREADEPFVIRNSKQLSQVLIDTVSAFAVKDEGKIIIDLEQQPLTVCADLVVNNNPFMSINFAKAALKQDTLEITIFESNESSDHFYKIKVIKGRYIVKYDFSTTMDEKNRQIKTLETKLILNTSDYKKGRIIRGYTSLKGKCNRECYFNPIIVAGNFSAKIE